MTTFHYSHSFSESPMDTISWNQFVQLVAIGENGLRENIGSLRRIAALDASVYAQMKKQLPWICFGSFRNDIRKLANFDSISHLVLDFDKIIGAENTPEFVKGKLQADKRLLAAFISPSGQGIKAIFKLERNIHCAKEYSDFYKQFASTFSNGHHLSEYCDLSTCDATRVCFLSYDPDIYYNPDALNLQVHNTVPELFKLQPEDAIEDPEPAKKPGHPDRDALDAIKQKLLQKPTRPKPSKHYFVPEAVVDHLPFLKMTLAEYDLVFADQSEVQYGIKITVHAGNPAIKAVCNIYYGKKGFSVVQVPMHKTNTALSGLLEKVIWHSIQQRYLPEGKIISLQSNGC